MLEIKNLRAQFEETEILKGVNIHVQAGEIHIILGPNGSGKSTLGHVILGNKAYRKTDGEILFNGENIEKFSSAERAKAGIFLSFQSPPEISGVSVHEFLFAAKKSIDSQFSSSFRFKKNLEKSFENLRLPADFIERETNVGFSGGERKKNRDGQSRNA